MQQVKISALRVALRRYSRVVLSGAPLEVASYGDAVGVLVKSSEISLDKPLAISRKEFRAKLSQCCEGLLGGCQGYVVTYHDRPQMAFVSPEFAKESGVYKS